NQKSFVFISSLTVLGVILGFTLANVICACLTSMFTEESILNYAWRIPFLFGTLLALLGWYFRKINTDQYSLQKNAFKNEKTPIDFTVVLKIAMIFTLSTTLFYWQFIYIPNLEMLNQHSTLKLTFNFNMYLLILIFFSVVIFAKLSDFINAK